MNIEILTLFWQLCHQHLTNNCFLWARVTVQHTKCTCNCSNNKDSDSCQINWTENQNKKLILDYRSHILPLCCQFTEYFSLLPGIDSWLIGKVCNSGGKLLIQSEYSRRGTPLSKTGEQHSAIAEIFFLRIIFAHITSCIHLQMLMIIILFPNTKLQI